MTELISLASKILEAVVIKTSVKYLEEIPAEVSRKIEELLVDEKKLRESKMVIIGLGQCGENILLTVSNLLDASRQDQSKTTDIVAAGMFERAKTFVKKPFKRKTASGPKYWFEPGLVVVDLFSSKISSKVLGADLRWLNFQGTGNIQIKGQYLARIALLAKDAGEKNWPESRAYLLTPYGDKSKTLISISIFAAGGGSGSGFAPELAYAQIGAQLKNVAAGSPARGTILGTCVLPDSPDMPSRASINAGRLFCRIFAAFGLMDTGAHESKKFNINAHAHFDALFIVSNFDARDERDQETKPQSVVEKNQWANQYIAHQLFCLLASQADSSDEQDRTNNKQPTGEEFLTFDENDIRNSLSGLVCPAFSYVPTGEVTANPLQAAETAFISSFKLRNFEQKDIFGISVCPIEPAEYKKLLDQATDADALSRALSERRPFYGLDSGAVMISVPDGYVLPQAFLSRLISLFKILAIKNLRWTIVRGPYKDRVALNVYFSQTFALSWEVQKHFCNYLEKCFDFSVEDVNRAIDGLWSPPPQVCNEKYEATVGDATQQLNLVREFSGYKSRFKEPDGKDCIVDSNLVQAAFAYLRKLQSAESKSKEKKSVKTSSTGQKDASKRPGSVNEKPKLRNRNKKG